MKKMVCEICESQSIRKENGVFVCQECGTEYSIEEAKKLLKEIGDAETAKNDTGSEEANNKVTISKSFEKNKNEILYYLYLWLDILSKFKDATFWCGKDSYGLVNSEYVDYVVNSKKVAIPSLPDSIFYKDVPLEELRKYRFYDADTLSLELLYHFYDSDSKIKGLIDNFNKEIRFSKFLDPNNPYQSFESSDYKYYLGPLPNGKICSLEYALTHQGETFTSTSQWMIYTALGRNSNFPNGRFDIKMQSAERGFIAYKYKFDYVTSSFQVDAIMSFIKNKVGLYKERHNKLIAYYEEHFDEAMENYKKLAEEIIELNKVFSLPDDYRKLSSLSYLINCFKNGRADSWKEAVNLLELEKNLSNISFKLDMISSELRILRADLQVSLTQIGMGLLHISDSLSSINDNLINVNAGVKQIMYDTRYSLICQLIG